MATANTTASDYQDYQCPVCLFALQEPVRTSCGHVFCKGCLDPVIQRQQPCPQCREPIQDNTQPAQDFSRRMKARNFVCDGCGHKCSLDGAKAHEIDCREASRKQKAKVVELRQQHRGRGGLQLHAATSNRMTFSCAYCNELNFDRESLLEHCLANHRNAPNHQLVCTICIAYPWGDQNQKSGHLLDHLQRRHKFDYDRFVDLDRTDEAALNDALQYSAAMGDYRR